MNRRGSVAIETAVCLTAVLLLLVGVIQSALWAFQRNSIDFAVKQAVRYASVRGGASGMPVDADAIRLYIREQAPALDPARLNVTTRWLPDNQPGSQVKVEARYEAPVFLKALVPNLALTTMASGVISQ